MTYTPAFFDANVDGALTSARLILPDIICTVGAESVVDVGCAQGAWLSVAKHCGCTVKGFDGFVPDDRLLLEPGEFERRNLDDGVNCHGYDLALCLEVAEHLPASSAETLVAGLCGAPWVLFSPAHPGQGGIGHEHEAWGSWWADLFANEGYAGTSDLKWRHWTDRRVHDFYRENLLLFARVDDLTAAGFTPGVVDVIHPERLGQW